MELYLEGLKNRAILYLSMFLDGVLLENWRKIRKKIIFFKFVLKYIKISLIDLKM